MLIAFLGRKRSGKDTVADFLIKNKGFQKYVFADPLKKGLKAFFNLTDEQLYDEKLKEEIDPRWGVSPRKLLQIIGTDIFQHSLNKFIPDLKGETRNHWVNLFKEWYMKEIEKNPNVKIVIADARFIHEVKAIKELGGVVIKINRTVSNNINNDIHISEMEIDSIPDNMIDQTIMNDDTLETLYQRVNQINFLNYL
jgi:dephospho-CoA kinase